MAWFDALVVGGGFGGAFCARRLEQLLRDRGERVVLVAEDNFLLFSPLLPEAASGTLEPRHAVIPLRELLKRTEVIVGEVISLDVEARLAEVRDINGDRHDIEFGSAVLAPGAVPAVLPIPGLAENAVGFKTLADAIWLRNRVVTQLEAASVAHDLERRRELLTFTVIGGGYAGVEALAELESFARDALRHYPALAPKDLRWVLVEATDRLLTGFPDRLATYTERYLRQRGIEVHLRTRLVDCEERVVELDGDPVAPYRSETIVWTAGQRPSPLLARLGFPTDERDRVAVDAHLRLPGHEDLYAVGDAAAVPDPDGGTCPMTAQHALRQGLAAAVNVAAGFGVGGPAPFTYRNRGMAVTLGRGKGTAQVRQFTFKGLLAWWMGRSYHLLMMPGWGRRIRVVADWTMAALFPRDVAQLGSLGKPSRL